MPDDDLVVEVPSEPTPEPVAEHQPAPAVKETEPEPVAPIEIEPVADLKKQLDDLRAQREADRRAAEEARAKAERDAKAHEDELAKARQSIDESNLAAVDNAIAAAQREADAYQREQQSAFETGDFAKAAEMGRKMAKAEARLERLEEGKADLAERRNAPKPEPAPKIDDPFEAAVSQAPPRAQKWLREHPQYVTDQKLNLKAGAAHQLALAEGIMPETDAYFDFCERQLGLKQEEPAAAPAPQPNGHTKAQAKPMPGAPVSREGPTSGQLSPTQVTLTPGEQRAATDGTLVWNYNDEKRGAVKGQPIGIKEMARRKIEMTRQGAYDRSYTDQ